MNVAQADWELLAQMDPMWAICSDPAKAKGGWESEDFFTTGEEEINKVMFYLTSLGVEIDYNSSVLDFGCGIGRLTRALGNRFKYVYGVDISPTMIERALAWTTDHKNVNFVCMEDCALRFQEKKFGFIYSSLVLQHIEPSTANRYIGELMDLLDSRSILVFQIADSYRILGNPMIGQIFNNFRARAKIRTRMRNLWFSKTTSLTPHIRTYGLLENKIRQTIKAHSGHIVNIQLTNSLKPNFNGNLRFLDETPYFGWVSKQYCVVKD